VFLVGDPTQAVRELCCEWRRLPTRDADVRFYERVVRPEITRRVVEFTEIVGPVLVIT